MLAVVLCSVIHFATTAPAAKEAGEITSERLVGTWLYDDENHGQIVPPSLLASGSWLLKYEPPRSRLSRS
jgi:hypothetical protein